MFKTWLMQECALKVKLKSRGAKMGNSVDNNKRKEKNEVKQSLVPVKLLNIEENSILKICVP